MAHSTTNSAVYKAFSKQSVDTIGLQSVPPLGIEELDDDVNSDHDHIVTEEHPSQVI